MDPKSPNHPTHVSSIQRLHMRLLVLVCPLWWGNFLRRGNPLNVQNLELNLCCTLKKSLLCVRLVRHSMRSAGVASTVRSMSLGRWLLVACFSSVKNHNVSGPHLFPSVTTHAKKIPLPPLGRSYTEEKNHFAIGRNSERCSYHTDLSRFVLPISDPSALNLSQFVEFQDSQICAKSKKLRKRANSTEKSRCSSKEP